MRLQPRISLTTSARSHWIPVRVRSPLLPENQIESNQSEERNAKRTNKITSSTFVIMNNRDLLSGETPSRTFFLSSDANRRSHAGTTACTQVPAMYWRSNRSEIISNSRNPASNPNFCISRFYFLSFPRRAGDEIGTNAAGRRKLYTLERSACFLGSRFGDRRSEDRI